MRHCQANVSSFASVTADGAIVQFLLDKREYQVDLANMAEAATALGITSFGIQVCQGLLDYYDSWKGRDSDISSARESVAELSATLVLLEESLKREELDDRRSQRVDESLQGCWSSLKDLSETCQELRQNDEPVGFRQKARSALERSQYHFRKKALVKARETVNEVRESLKLAVQILQLDTSTHSQSILNEVAADARATAERTQHILDAQQSDLFRRITDWLSPADPGTNHASARERYEPETGEWLLQSDQYSAWKDGDIKHLWLYGKPGCGKTILCSSAIEDIRLHCIGAGNFAHASFYFTFSDTDKQSYNSLLRSLVVQLGWKKPSLSMLAETYEKSSRTRPPRDTLEKILLLAIEAFDEVFLLLDALDECPDTDETRQGVLDGLERLMQRTSKLRVLATSREVSDVRECMRVLRADVIAIHTQAVNKDIQTWVLNWLLRDRKLRSLDVATKTLIEETISRKADGMFRWAYCQLQELKRLKSTKPKYIQYALRNLPATLDATYERMLTSIEDLYRDDAIILLRWLAYAESPPTLAELAEATIIDPRGGGSVDIANRGRIEDALAILGGFVVIERNEHGGDSVSGKDERDIDKDHKHGFDYQEREGMSDAGTRSGQDLTERGAESTTISMTGNSDGSHSKYHFSKNTRVRLAHFSIQEYLESSRILQTEAKDFYLHGPTNHSYLAQCCLVYLLQYCERYKNLLVHGNQEEFPLHQYAVFSWQHHMSISSDDEITVQLAVRLLSLDEHVLAWTLEDQWVVEEWNEEELAIVRWKVHAPGLWYAIQAGLDKVVDALTRCGSDVNAQEGLPGSALYLAASGSHAKVVRILIDRGAHLDTDTGSSGTALQVASVNGNEEIVRMLLRAGADVNSTEGQFGSALQAAVYHGHIAVVQMLLRHGANVDARGGQFETALQAAVVQDLKEVVRLLLDAGADPDLQGGTFGSALHAATRWRRLDILRMLITAGANLEIKDKHDERVIQIAFLMRSDDRLLRTLIAAGAHVNDLDLDGHGSLLQLASYEGREELVETLLKNGADVNARGGRFDDALRAAAFGGCEKVVTTLMAAGADLNAQGGKWGSALQVASWMSHEKVVRLLLAEGANVNLEGGNYGTALEAAAQGRRASEAESSLNQNGPFGRKAWIMRYETIRTMLLEAGAVNHAQPNLGRMNLGTP